MLTFRPAAGKTFPPPRTMIYGGVSEAAGTDAYRIRAYVSRRVGEESDELRLGLRGRLPSITESQDDSHRITGALGRYCLPGAAASRRRPYVGAAAPAGRDGARGPQLSEVGRSPLGCGGHPCRSRTYP